MRSQLPAPRTQTRVSPIPCLHYVDEPDSAEGTFGKPDKPTLSASSITKHPIDSGWSSRTTLQLSACLMPLYTKKHTHPFPVRESGYSNEAEKQKNLSGISTLPIILPQVYAPLKAFQEPKVVHASALLPSANRAIDSNLFWRTERKDVQL